MKIAELKAIRAGYESRLVYLAVPSHFAPAQCLDRANACRKHIAKLSRWIRRAGK